MYYAYEPYGEECECLRALARNDLFFLTHIIIKNDIYHLYIINKQQPQRSSKSNSHKAPSVP